MNEHSQNTSPDEGDIEYSNSAPEATDEISVEVAEQSKISVESSSRAANEAVSGDAEQAIKSLSRRSFLWSALAVGAGYGAFRWLGSRRDVNGLSWPLRQSHELNAQVSQEFLPPSSRLAPTFARHQISTPRVNGDIGLDTLLFNPETWKLRVKGLASGEELQLSLTEIQKLPRVEMTTELKCIEGWSIVVHWAGARFKDFSQKFAPLEDATFVGMATPDEAYYVGLDIASALHPQTLLCYEMNGAPLSLEHGAPLRLVTPIKYGIKNIKRIGRIEYSKRRPGDYWAERGYDWYSGI